MTSTTAGLALLTLAMLLSSGWLWRKTHSTIVLIINVCVWLCVGYGAGLIA